MSGCHQRRRDRGFLAHSMFKAPHDAAKKLFWFERLTQEAEGPRGECLVRGGVIDLPGHHDNRCGHAPLVQSLFEFETIEPRHLNIGDDALRNPKLGRAQKGFRARKCGGAVTCRNLEPAGLEVTLQLRAEAPN